MNGSFPNRHGLGVYVRDRRRALGLTQRELGERIDWVQERVSLLERGGYGIPSIVILARLADALETPLSFLLAALGHRDLHPAAVGQVEAESPRSAALLYTLEQLLALPDTGFQAVMDQASDVVARAMGADMVEAFLYDHSSRSLTSLGSSAAPFAVHQGDLGLDRLPIPRDGRIVEVFHTGQSYATGHADQDIRIAGGMRQALGVRSLLATPISVAERRIGVLVAESVHPERFIEDELHFFGAVAHWLGLIAHRAQLLYNDAIDVEAE